MKQGQSLLVSDTNDSVVIQAGRNIGGVTVVKENKPLQKNLEEDFLKTAWNILSCFEQLQHKLQEGSENDPSGIALQKEIDTLAWQLRELLQHLSTYKQDMTESSKEILSSVERVYAAVAQILNSRQGLLQELQSVIQSLSITLQIMR